MKERWAASGAQLHYYQLDGAPVWSGAGHLDCPELRAATATLFAGEPA